MAQIAVSYEIYDLDLHCYVDPEAVRLDAGGRIVQYLEAGEWVDYTETARWLEIRSATIVANGRYHKYQVFPAPRKKDT